MERLRWAVQKRFNVLPTDPNFLSLTDEQLLLIEEHMQRDIEIQEEAMKSIRKTNANDPDYEEPEKYTDPGFDDEWDSLNTGENSESSIVDEDEWEEVE